MDRIGLIEKFAEPYRMACPRGHTALEPHKTLESAHCRTCKRSYDFEELVDKKQDAQERGGIGL